MIKLERYVSYLAICMTSFTQESRRPSSLPLLWCNPRVTCNINYRSQRSLLFGGSIGRRSGGESIIFGTDCLYWTTQKWNIACGGGDIGQRDSTSRALSKWNLGLGVCLISPCFSHLIRLSLTRINAAEEVLAASPERGLLNLLILVKIDAQLKAIGAPTTIRVNSLNMCVLPVRAVFRVSARRLRPITFDGVFLLN